MPYPQIYYRVTEINNVITERNIIFKPKGPGLYIAELTYTFGEFKITQEYRNDHRLPVGKFGRWVQRYQVEIERKFMNVVTAMRLEAELNGDKELHHKLLEQPVIGTFRAWVL